MTKTELIIMDLAVEDEVGLWELRWRLETLETATAPDLTVLLEAVDSLVRRGFLTAVVMGPESSARREASEAELRELLHEPQFWAEPDQHSPQIRVVATEEGEQAYYDRE